MKTLDSPSLRLEALTKQHADAMFDGLSDSRLYEFIADEPPVSVEALRQRYAVLESRRSPSGEALWLNWVITTKPELRARGYVQATVTGAVAVIAYVLFMDAWGQGIASAAIEIMLPHLQEAYSVRRAVAHVDPRNHRSIQLLLRLGFTHSRTREQAEWIRGILADEAEYELRLAG